MDSLSDFVEAVVKKAEEANKPEPEDYYDEEGYLCCGRCNTRREMDVDLAVQDSVMVNRRVRVLCSCRSKELKEKELAERKKADMEFISSLRKESLMDDRVSNASFESFEVTEYNARNLKLCRSYAERFDLMVEKNQGLLMYGGVGTGKTYAAACIANFLLDKRVPVVMTSFVKLLESMKGFDKEDNLVMSKLNLAKLLIIDDLGAERETGYALERVYDIIDSRYRSRLPLILTTNLGLEEMKSSIDVRYKRIYDRIFELCYPLQFTGPSWRKKEASRRFREMEKLLEGE